MTGVGPKWQISQTATSSTVGRQADIVQARLVLIHTKQKRQAEGENNSIY
jgi:hypothetical protein